MSIQVNLPFLAEGTPFVTSIEAEHMTFRKAKCKDLINAFWRLNCINRLEYFMEVQEG